jgi:catechol 2,3-dioxygenase-like lactoylglutathione lyase family enzyme
MRVERPEPVLPSRDLAETRAFYGRLGFVPWFAGREPWHYEIMSRGNLVVHFFPHPELDPFKSDAGCYWRVRDADRLHAELAELGLPKEGIPRLTRPADTPWGMREFTLVDPSGNLVRIGHDLGDAYVAAER